MMNNHNRSSGGRGRGRGRGRGKGRHTQSAFLHPTPAQIIDYSGDANEYSEDAKLKDDNLGGICGSSSSAQSSPPHASMPNFTNLKKLDNNSPHSPLSSTFSELNDSPLSNSNTLSPLPPTIHIPNPSNHSHLPHPSTSITNSTTSDQENECSQGNIAIIHIPTSDSSSTTLPFDICLDKTGTPFKLKPSLLVQNRQKRNEVKRAIQGQSSIIELRPGMVLLKHYISCPDQIKIVKTCQKLGLGTGGFYQPGYRDGAKLQLKMMCLGQDWNPETSKYGERRPIDGAKPPPIPMEFHQFVCSALEDSCAALQKKIKLNNNERPVPLMVPDICIVNFYTNSGRLGLHQDKDESAESLGSGLPVVSISIGDSAEFLYGDQRDIAKAEKIILESGDVLIFGGKSRLVFHGVSSILAKTAPEPLLEESNLRPGRLNLTFRKY